MAVIHNLTFFPHENGHGLTSIEHASRQKGKIVEINGIL